MTENILVGRLARPSVAAFALASTLFACGKGGESTADTTQATPATASAEAPNPNAPILLRGTVTSVSADKLVLKSDTGAVTVGITQPFHVYTRGKSDLSHVQQNSFVGVTSVKQADGSERATQINIFPEELRGLGEGTRMMTGNQSAAGSRMTNGNVSASRMTNGNVSASRMTNGNVSSSRMSNGNVSATNGSSIVVQYAGGSQTVTVPPNTPVTELKASTKKLAVGDQVAVMATKATDGSLTTDKAVSMAK